MRINPGMRSVVADELMEEWAKRGFLMGNWVHEGNVANIKEITLHCGKYLRIASSGEVKMVYYIRSGR